MSRRLHIAAKANVVTATVVHDGTNSPGYPQKVEGFAVQATSDTHFGKSGVTGSTDGFTVLAGETINLTGLLSRGTTDSYDLNQIYYIGGPWKLIIEETI